MKRVIANKSLSNTFSKLTQGKEYQVIHDLLNNYILIDDTGYEALFNKDLFNEKEIFDPSQFAMSIVKLMLFPKSKGHTDEDIVRAKASAILVTEICKRNCESQYEIEMVDQITKAIDEIEL